MDVEQIRRALGVTCAFCLEATFAMRKFADGIIDEDLADSMRGLAPHVTAHAELVDITKEDIALIISAVKGSDGYHAEGVVIEGIRYHCWTEYAVDFVRRVASMIEDSTALDADPNDRESLVNAWYLLAMSVPPPINFQNVMKGVEFEQISLSSDPRFPPKPQVPRASLASRTEIAHACYVSNQAVSNWKSRHVDFPPVVDRDGIEDLYLRKAITEWCASRKQKCDWERS